MRREIAEGTKARAQQQCTVVYETSKVWSLEGAVMALQPTCNAELARDGCVAAGKGWSLALCVCARAHVCVATHSVVVFTTHSGVAAAARFAVYPHTRNGVRAHVEENNEAVLTQSKTIATFRATRIPQPAELSVHRSLGSQRSLGLTFAHS